MSRQVLGLLGWLGVSFAAAAVGGRLMGIAAWLVGRERGFSERILAEDTTAAGRASRGTPIVPALRAALLPPR